MTHMLGEGFEFARYIGFHNVSQLIPDETLRKMGMGTLRFCEVHKPIYTALRPFNRELNLNEALSCMYLVYHGLDFGVDHGKMNKRLSDARAKGRMPESMMLFFNFPMQVTERQNTFHLVKRVHG